jgi:hypothetical protein
MWAVKQGRDFQPPHRRLSFHCLWAWRRPCDIKLAWRKCPFPSWHYSIVGSGSRGIKSDILRIPVTVLVWCGQGVRSPDSMRSCIVPFGRGWIDLHLLGRPVIVVIVFRFPNSSYRVSLVRRSTFRMNGHRLGLPFSVGFPLWKLAGCSPCQLGVFGQRRPFSVKFSYWKRPPA